MPAYTPPMNQAALYSDSARNAMSQGVSTGPKARGAPAGSNVPSGYRGASVQQFNPGQMDLFQRNLDLVGPNSQLYQQAMGTDAGFAPYEQYAQRQFQEATGQNASRFSGLGMGARRGSGFQNLQTQGAQDFATQLAMQRQQLQRQALNDLLGISQSLLGQRPQENMLVKKQMPFWQQLAVTGTQGFAEGAGKAAATAAFA